jgi:hypothetical protein
MDFAQCEICGSARGPVEAIIAAHQAKARAEILKAKESQEGGEPKVEVKKKTPE